MSLGTFNPSFVLNGFNPATITPPTGEIGQIGFRAVAGENALLVYLAGGIVLAVDLDLADDEVAIGGPDAAGDRRLGLWVHDPTSNLHRQVGAPGLPQVIRSDKDTDFVLAQAQNVSDDANLAGLNGNSGRIRSVTVLADQALAWEIAFYSTDGFSDPDADVDSYIDSVRFSEGDGLQDDGAGLYRYCASGLDIPYVDDDGTNEVHCRVINRSATGKNAGATGEIVVRVTIEESA